MKPIFQTNINLGSLINNILRENSFFYIILIVLSFIHLFFLFVLLGLLIIQFFQLKKYINSSIKIFSDGIEFNNKKYSLEQIHSIMPKRFVKMEYFSLIKIDVDGLSIKTSDGIIHRIPSFFYENKSHLQVYLKEINEKLHYETNIVINELPQSVKRELIPLNQIDLNKCEEIILPKPEITGYIFSFLAVSFKLYLILKKNQIENELVFTILIILIGIIFVFIYLKACNNKFILKNEENLYIPKNKTLFLKITITNTEKIEFTPGKDRFRIEIFYKDYSELEEILDLTYYKSILELIEKMEIKYRINS